MTSFVLYTHSSYNDCWDAFFRRNKKHFNLDFDNYYIFTDKVNHPVDERFQPVIYKDNDSYTNRLVHCLSQLDDAHLFFTHEDMILYNDVHKDYMVECLNAIPNVDFIKLLKGGGSKGLNIDQPYKSSRVLKETLPNFDYLFAIQPSLWNRNTFLELLNNNLNQSIWEFEVSGQNFCRQTDFKSLYTYVLDIDKKRGEHHYDSVVYPYIATAILKGKWTTSEYPKELNDLACEFNIDMSIRGCV